MTELPANRRAPVVAIDGPAGAGKTTVAKAVARALGLLHLDTGAMYRAVTARALAAGVDPADERGLVEVASRMKVELTPQGLLVDGAPAGDAVRSREVNRWVSTVAAHGGVRAELVRMQREVLARGGVVAEGRDIGTVVYPRAPVKVFLTASIDERARRRHAEVSDAGESVPVEAIVREIADRDQIDSSRAVSPLVPASDAVVLDTTAMSVDEVVEEVARLARAAAATATEA